VSESAPKRLVAKLLEESNFIREYVWKYRKYMIVGLVALMIVDLLEVLPPILLMRAVDVAVESRPHRELAYAAALYLAVALFQAVGRYGWRMYLIRASMFAGRDLREKYAHHLFTLSMSFFDRKRIGDLMSLATNDVDAVRMCIGAGILVFADAVFYLLTIPVAMYLLSPKLTLLAFVTLPIVPWIVIRNDREIHHRFDQVQACSGKLSALAQESLSGIRVIKGFAKEDAKLARFEAAGREYMYWGVRLARVHTAFGPTLDFLMSLGLVLLLYFGGRHVVEGTVTLGTFVAFQRYIQQMVWPMAALGIAISNYQRAVTSSKRLKGVFVTSSDVPEEKTARMPAVVRGAVEFRGLTFGFPGSGPVLRGIDLKIAPGERVAFVGGIGSGKSALLSLVPRLYPVGRGMLWIDGVDVNDWPLRALREHVGYVSQDVFLFSETVSENVAFGLGSSVGTASVQDATQMAAVHDDILGLVESYGTRLGERGINLSGGQKQRLTIARALAKQPAILVLDDALSSVDVQTEEEILAGLRARPNRNTELIAAHRISTIREADRIVVLHDGGIAQQGKHAELLRDRSGIYRKFYDQQQLKAELEPYVAELEIPKGEDHGLRP
jgi:ATP-binding cassette, subfamily B, multidrug efflux pump